MRTLYIQLAKNRIRILQFFKWLTIPLVVFALYYQLFVQFDFSELKSTFVNHITPQSWVYGLVALCLMPINLGLESLKWKEVLKQSHNISFQESWQSIFAGISLSMFTPKRIGEYAGRIILLPKNQAQAVPSLIVSNLSQSISNVLLGLLSLLLFAYQYSINIENLTWGIVASICFFLLLLGLYFNLGMVQSMVSNVNFLKQINKYTAHIEEFSRITLYKILSLSLVKYLVFIAQFVFIILAFGVDVPIFWSVVAASCVFFVKTILPLPSTVEIAARGPIAIYFFSALTSNHIGVLVASIVLWIMNLAIPALLGSYYISKK